MGLWEELFGKGAGEAGTAGGALGGAMGAASGAAVGAASGAAAGSAAGPLGAIAGAVGGGIGNLIAPSIFGDMDTPGSHTEEVPADGFKPSTGNQYVDSAVNGVKDIANMI